MLISKKSGNTIDKAGGENKHKECEITFTYLGDGTTKVEEEFYPEETNILEQQKAGWTAILENFIKFVTSN